MVLCCLLLAACSGAGKLGYINPRIIAAAEQSLNTPPPDVVVYPPAKKGQLNTRYIKTVWNGDHLRMLILADRYYYPKTQNLRTERLAELKQVVEFLNYYPLTRVTVTGYTDNRGWKQRNQSLSTARADILVHYLRQHGLNNRFVVAVGKGSAKKIASNHSRESRGFNRRIEITGQIFHS